MRAGKGPSRRLPEYRSGALEGGVIPAEIGGKMLYNGPGNPWGDISEPTARRVRIFTTTSFLEGRP